LHGWKEKLNLVAENPSSHMHMIVWILVTAFRTVAGAWNYNIYERLFRGFVAGFDFTQL
jgi:uncharacterized Fe-S radical SAM superfamily protein PflX